MSTSPVENSAPASSEKPAEQQPTPEEKQSVAYETHRRLLDEKKKLQARLDEIETQRKAREEEELAKKGEVQKILELREKELTETREKLRLKEERETEARKLSAVLRGLGGNVDDKWFSVIGSHIDELAVNPDTGEIDEMSVTRVVEGLKRTWPEMLKKPVVGMPNGVPQGSATTISRDEWLKLPSKEMQKWRPEQII
jgi:hypothetical protein